MLWVVFALIGVVFQAAFTESNRHFRADSYTLNVWHGMASVILMIPALFFIDWPSGVAFYLTAFFAGAVSAIACVVQFHLASKHNGRVASMFLPVEAFAMFFLWIALKPTLIGDYMASPVATATIGASMILASVSLFFLRRNDVGWSTFWSIAPIGLLYAVAGVLCKNIIDPDNFISSLLAYTFVFYVSLTVQMAAVVALRRRHTVREIFTPQMARAGFIIAVFSVMSCIGLFGGFALAENPGYTAIALMLVPVVLMAWHRATGTQDDASPIAGMGLVIAGALLVWATQA